MEQAVPWSRLLKALSPYDYHESRGKLKKMEESPRKTLTAQRERVKAQIRAKVEHPFHVVKNLSVIPLPIGEGVKRTGERVMAQLLLN